MGTGPARNFWVTTTADGANSAQATGPRNKLGGFETEVRVWHHGESVVALRVLGFAEEDGTLKLEVIPVDGFEPEETRNGPNLAGLTIGAHR